MARGGRRSALLTRVNQPSRAVDPAMPLASCSVSNRSPSGDPIGNPCRRASARSCAYSLIAVALVSANPQRRSRAMTMARQHEALR
jgi:hypothetical protein